MGVDARDYIRGTRPWGQFLVYATYLGQLDGGKLWAAQLDDDRFLPVIAEQLKENRKVGATRPPLAGYSREVDALFRVATELRMLRAEMGRWNSAPPILGPVFPSERIQDALDKQEINDVLTAVEEGRTNWREAHHD